jgi:hypothetical protein
VQLLRGFRDNSILRTAAGSSFMTVFNSWYYSFSPSVAGYLTQHQPERTAVKIFLYPLIGILKASSAVFDVTSSVPELAAMLSGLVASSLIGAIYLGLPSGLMRAKMHRLGGKRGQQYEKGMALVLFSGLTALLIGEMLASSALLMISSVVVVLSTMILAAAVTSRMICRTVESHKKAYFVKMPNL